jgi:hypothetical protein
MKKKLSSISVVFIFLLSLLYLHQKVLIYIEAYRLTKTHRFYNELVDRRDYLVYNLNKETSVPKVNQWAERHNFTPVSKNKVLALNLKREGTPVSKNKVASFFSHILRISATSDTALAEGKE